MSSDSSNNQIITLFGGPALQAFQLARLERHVQAACGQTLAGIQAYLVYAVQLHSGAELPPARQEALCRLLDAAQDAPELNGPILLCTPRPGTISPWSSKATDIARRCGLSEIARIELCTLYHLPDELPDAARECFYDPMLQQLAGRLDGIPALFSAQPRRALQRFSGDLANALRQANQNLSLALSDTELDYLRDGYQQLGRAPTDAELMMFAQANSEHCRHKIFNAQWHIDGQPQERSLFAMIRNTHTSHPDNVLSAYHDNAAVVAGSPARMLQTTDTQHEYHVVEEVSNFQIKVETHNHPTAISPFPGAATGSGGEIRDEAATGRGAVPKAGLTGFSVSELQLPGHGREWETGISTPDRMASALQIMLQGPIGAAAFNNEFGRPALGGYFRSFTQPRAAGQADTGADSQGWWGYHKPIMIAGGLGHIRTSQVDKLTLPPDARIIVLGGPAMLIGLGGGAASSVHSGASDAGFDYASVQRGNPEMQRRCQEVINRCWALGKSNPILAIHDVGAGGLSNAIPELLNDSGRGGQIELREVPCDDPALSPMEIWCNEAQERYVLGIEAADLERFTALCERERCPFAVVGSATEALQLVVNDRDAGAAVIDMPMPMLLGKMPSMQRRAESLDIDPPENQLSGLDLGESLHRVLGLPAVAGKSFLITIGDRSVGGLSCRDQMVGPWQVPVADHALMLDDFSGVTGQAMSMGERTPLAVDNAPASGRMAVAEAVTNLAGAPVGQLNNIKLSANWMAAAGQSGQDAALYATVQAVGMELCPALGLAIPVGKDSLSMHANWQNAGDEKVQHRMQAPLSLIVSAFAPVHDARLAVTPQLQVDRNSQEDSRIVLIDFSRGRQRLGQSALAQVWELPGGEVADAEHPQALVAGFNILQQALGEQRLLACHDRSDGGLIVTLLEMAFAAHCGLRVQVPESADPLAWLFNEELGVVAQVTPDNHNWLQQQFAAAGMADCIHHAAALAGDGCLSVEHGSVEHLHEPMWSLNKLWAETSHVIQRLRDNPECADEEYHRLDQWQDAGLQPQLTFTPREAPMVHTGQVPRVAILREQGVNSQVEMAAGFMHAGFSAVDVHMSDLNADPAMLEQFQGVVACGGFSYGDVLGAGRGWARSILFNPALRDAFAGFFARNDRFALGVCNGCQVLSALRELIPGTEHWPDFGHNRSGQYESRLSLVEITASPSLFFAGMHGSRIPITTAHGEGRAIFASGQDQQAAAVAMRYIEGDGTPATDYPANPNGSPMGICGLSNSDGRVTISMPHPERLLRTLNFSWAPKDWGPVSPWMQMFHNARDWCR